MPRPETLQLIHYYKQTISEYERRISVMEEENDDGTNVEFFWGHPAIWHLPSTPVTWAWNTYDYRIKLFPPEERILELLGVSFVEESTKQAIRDIINSEKKVSPESSKEDTTSENTVDQPQPFTLIKDHKKLDANTASEYLDRACEFYGALRLSPARCPGMCWWGVGVDNGSEALLNDYRSNSYEETIVKLVLEMDRRWGPGPVSFNYRDYLRQV